jgi:hypothetical protein
MTEAQQAAAANEKFPRLFTMNADELMRRREEIHDTVLKDGVRDYAALSDDSLEELFEINRLIRRKNSGPPKAKASKANGKTAASGGIDDLD